MKEVGTTNWNSSNIKVTNKSLFTGLPGGYRDGNGNYHNIGTNGDWWSSTEDRTSSASAWSRYLYSSNGSANRFSHLQENGLSVRCLRD